MGCHLHQSRQSRKIDILRELKVRTFVLSEKSRRRASLTWRVNVTAACSALVLEDVSGAQVRRSGGTDDPDRLQHVQEHPGIDWTLSLY